MAGESTVEQEKGQTAMKVDLQSGSFISTGRLPTPGTLVDLVFEDGTVKENVIFIASVRPMVETSGIAHILSSGRKPHPKSYVRYSTDEITAEAVKWADLLDITWMG